MKNLTKLFFMSIFAAGLFACSSDDDPIVENEVQNVDKVYMSVNLSFPESRSATDENKGDTPSDEETDSEVGTTAENTVKTVQLVFMNKAGNFVVSNPTSVEGSDPYIVTFQSGSLQQLANQDVDVYVICGGKPTVTTAITSATYDAETPFYEDNNFLMTNAKKATTCTIPSASEFGKHQTEKSPLNINPVDDRGQVIPIAVERAAARIDYKEFNKSSYDIEVYDENGKPQADQDSKIDIKLESMALLNQSKSFYLMRRVAAAKDTPSDQYQIGGTEVPLSYVVDTDWKAKTDFFNGATSDQARYTYANFVNNSIIKGTDIETFHKNKAGKFTDLKPGSSQTPSQWGTKDYYSKFYTSENTLPSTAAEALKGVATCVVFKGHIDYSQDADLVAGIDDGTTQKDPNLYVFKNTLYGTWEMIGKRIAAKDVTLPTNVKEAYQAAEAAAKAANPENPQVTNEMARLQGFTVYDKVDSNADGEKDEYPVYYYYWNEHNKVMEDSKPKPDAPMFYGVVRNNVYKLSVTDIKLYGHPHNPDGDPDPVLPTDPILTEDVYFSVSLTVLPWTVRVNDITF